MTDHRIRIPTPHAEVTSEIHTTYRGALVVFQGRATAQALEQAQALHRARLTGTSQAWSQTPPTPANLAALGDALMREGKPEQGRKILLQVLSLEPGNVTALNGLAVWEGVQGRLNNALRLLEQAKGFDPEHPLTWMNLGVTYEHLGDHRRALACYQEAIRLQPDSSEARRRRAALQAGLR